MRSSCPRATVSTCRSSRRLACSPPSTTTPAAASRRPCARSRSARSTTARSAARREEDQPQEELGPGEQGPRAHVVRHRRSLPDRPDGELAPGLLLRRDGQVHAYGVDSRLPDYSYYGATLLDWIVERLAGQTGSDDTPLEPVGAYLRAAGGPSHVLIGIGATRYNRRRRVDLPAAWRRVDRDRLRRRHADPGRRRRSRGRRPAKTSSPTPRCCGSSSCARRAAAPPRPRRPAGG